MLALAARNAADQLEMASCAVLRDLDAVCDTIVASGREDRLEP